MYTVIGLPMTRSFRVIWALEEMELPYDIKPHLPASDEVKAVSPNGKVPVLVDGEHLITDSIAIMSYLADKHGRLQAKAGTPERGKQDAVTLRIVDEMDALLWTKSRHKFILPKDKRVPEVSSSLAWEFGQNIEKLARDWATPYLGGPDFSAADIVFTHCVGWAKTAGFMIENQKMLQHAKNMRQRPAFLRASKHFG